jgi:hypothetical protein
MGRPHRLPSLTTNLAMYDVFKTNAFSIQLKKLYRDISQPETELLADSGKPQDGSRIVIEGGPLAGADEVEKVHWTSAFHSGSGDHPACPCFLVILQAWALLPRIYQSMRSLTTHRALTPLTKVIKASTDTFSICCPRSPLATMPTPSPFTQTCQSMPTWGRP